MWIRFSYLRYRFFPWFFFPVHLFRLLVFLFQKHQEQITYTHTHIRKLCRSAGVFRDWSIGLVRHCRSNQTAQKNLREKHPDCNAISNEFLIALWNSPASWEQRGSLQEKLSPNRLRTTTLGPGFWDPQAFHTISKLLSTSILKSERREKKKGTLQGRRVVYDVSLLMDYLLSGTATERDHKVTGDINWRRALEFPEFYTGPAALIHDCPAQGHQFSVSYHAVQNMQFVWLWLSLLHRAEQHFQLCEQEGGEHQRGLCSDCQRSGEGKGETLGNSFHPLFCWFPVLNNRVRIWVEMWQTLVQWQVGQGICIL